MKRSYLITGLIISIFIALLSFVLRSYRDSMASSTVVFIGAFANSFLSWLVIQWVISQAKPRSYGWKGALALIGCILISVLLFYVIQDTDQVRGRVEALPRGMRIVYFLLVIRGLVIGGFLYFIAYLLRITDINQQSRLENERLKKENLQARLTLLQEQLSPHFLFNSLGTLRTMVSEPGPRIFIQRLADVYRYLLNNRQADLVELRTEVDFARAYLHILQERFENALAVMFNVPEHYLAMKLPPMTLQLLIENAVKHNIVDAAAPLHLTIQADGSDRLTVRNSLRPKQQTGYTTGSGLTNIRERYRLLLGREIDVSQTPDEFIVTIFLEAPKP